MCVFIYIVDTDECQELSACPNAKFECVNLPGSFRCSCRYKNAKESDGCGMYTTMSVHCYLASNVLGLHLHM